MIFGLNSSHVPDSSLVSNADLSAHLCMHLFLHVDALCTKLFRYSLFIAKKALRLTEL